MSALYVIIDATTSLPVCRMFAADTSGHAASLAASLATSLGASVQLCPVGTVGPFTVVAPGGSQVTPASLSCTI